MCRRAAWRPRHRPLCGRVGDCEPLKTTPSTLRLFRYVPCRQCCRLNGLTARRRLKEAGRLHASACSGVETKQGQYFTRKEGLSSGLFYAGHRGVEPTFVSPEAKLGSCVG